MKRSFQVRIPADVHAKLKAAAKAAGISMNQLIEGVLYAYQQGAMKVEVQERVKVEGVERELGK